MVKYTREQRLRAVRLYERYGRSAVAVIDELGVSVRADAGGLAPAMGAGRSRRRRIACRQAWRTLHAGAEAGGGRALSHAWQVPAAHDAGVGLSKP